MLEKFSQIYVRISPKFAQSVLQMSKFNKEKIFNFMTPMIGKFWDHPYILDKFI